MITRLVIGLAIGGAVGALMGATRSCESGGCPLTSSPWMGMLWGAVMGIAVAAMTKTE